MARRSDHSREEIHQMALDAAEAIVSAEGYKGLSARKLATAINYTVGTLYLVFQNLDDIVLQVNERTLDALYHWLQTHTSQETAPDAQIHALASAYITYAKANTARWSMLFEYIAEKGNDFPDDYQLKVGKVFGLVEAALKPMAGQASAIELEQAARVLWASVHGICLLKIRQRLDLAGGQSTEDMTRLLIDNFLCGFQQARIPPAR